MKTIKQKVLERHPLLSRWGGVIKGRVRDYGDLMYAESEAIIGAMLTLMRDHQVPSLTACLVTGDLRNLRRPWVTRWNAGYQYLEVRCLGCDTHQTVALDVVRRAKATPVHELERYMRCKDCSQVRGYAYKRNHLVALRTRRISASDPPSTWWPGER